MNLRAEVDDHLKLEREAQFRWRRELARLDAKEATP
jgi:hypothetical protein